MTEYEQIKEKIGIDLVTIYKACKNGIYFKKLNEIKTWGIDNVDEVILVDFKEQSLLLFDNSMILGFNYEGDCVIGNYGTEWALTREELEEKNDTRTNQKIKARR